MRKLIAAVTIVILLISTFSFVIPRIQADPLIIFSDGFESGDFSAWTTISGSPTVQNTIVHHGSYAMMADTASNELAWDFFTQSSTTYARLYVRFASLPSANGYRVAVLGLLDADVATFNFNLDIYNRYSGEGDTVVWRLTTALDGWTSHFSDITPTVDTWYCVELKATGDGSAYSWEWWIDGASKGTGSGSTTSNGANRVTVGGAGKSEAIETYIDCVVVSDAPIGLEDATPEADIGVEKTGVDYAHEGDTVTYQFTVTNYGPNAANDVQIYDDVLGDLAGYLPDTTLNINEVNEFTVNYVVPTPSGDITNTVTVASSTLDPDATNNQASWTIDVLHSNIGVSKSGPAYAYPGDTITYTITVSNTGDCPLYSVSVVDTLLGPIYSNGLATGETKTFTFSYTVPASALTGELTNTVTAVGFDASGKQVTDSASWIVTVVPLSIVTDGKRRYSELFDTDSSMIDQQFRLIFTQDSINTYALRASNPGQFCYNVFYVGTAGETVTFDVRIPYPFVTQGSEPIHVYSLVTTSGGCFVPSGELLGFTISGTEMITPSGALGIDLADYSPPAFGSFVTIRITGEVPSSGLVYLTIHLNYGLKGTSSYGKNINDDAIDPSTSMIKIPNLYQYGLSVGGAMSDSQTIQNENIFKNDPGIAGLVLEDDGSPLQNVQVNIYSKGKLITTLYTDQDGWYQWLYKYTGKPTTYTIGLPEYDIQETIKFRAMLFVEVDFQLPNTITVYSSYHGPK